MKCLNKIYEWLEQYQPKVAESLQPGLTLDEIEEQARKLLPDRIAREVYELYQWKNGCKFQYKTVIVKVNGRIHTCQEGYIVSGMRLFLEPFSALYFNPLDKLSVLQRRDGVLI